MATLLQHVYAVKNILYNGIASDDSKISNSLIEHFLKMSRAVLLKQKLDRYRTLSEVNYLTVCMPLELTTYSECKCVPEDINCKIMRGTCKLPKEIVTHRNTTIQVKFIDGSIMDHTNITKNNLSKYSLTQKNPKSGGFIDNQNLFILNTTELPLVVVKGIWEDPASVDNFCDCGNAGNSPIPCHDSRNDEFPIDSELVIPMYSMTLEFLRTAFITPTDEENDTTNSRLSGQQS